MFRRSHFKQIIVIALFFSSAFVKPGFAVDTFALPSVSQPAVRTLTLAPEGSVAPQETPAKAAAQALPEEPLSAMEEFFSRAPGLEGPPLRQFGYEMFRGLLVGGNTVSDTSVPDDYPLGPGDELIFNVPLSTQEIRAVVSRDGTIFIPSFGTLSVTGQSLGKFQAAMRARARGAQVTVRLGKLRMVTAYLAGRVRRPGSYLVGALSTISTLLEAAGGVSKNGSLRHIELRRHERPVVIFDFYDFLLKGQNAGNVRIEAGDIIFVPTIGPQVAIAGNVRQPAIYEIKGGATLAESLRLSGGPLAQAYTQRILLQRIKANTGRELREIDVKDALLNQLRVQDGDLLIVDGNHELFEFAENHLQFKRLITS
ncbi:MAG: SLBB domain-containing protein, partial [Cyanobacteria bacterium NC_groundwater_1444_Ag_S-0.65um_54_12]|nr:SLBB domain-containing protein [Cyanobacteria bacterium NC_groundwater_1444_Ag_S-0.65um_54_12]